MRELFKEIWSTTKQNKLRTSLTGFAVAWGIFMLIFLLGAGNGLINAQMQQSDRLVVNSMKVIPGQTSKPYNGLKEGRNIEIDHIDLTNTRNNYQQHLDNVGGVVSQDGVNVNYGTNYLAQQTLEGVFPMHTKVDKMEILEGRFINDIDMSHQRKVVVLSRNQAKELCPHYQQLINQNVTISGFAFKVVGIFKDDESMVNQTLYAPFSTLCTIYAKGNTIDNIEMNIKGLETEEDNEAFEATYRAHINTRHQAAPDDESAIWIYNRYTQNMMMNKGIAIIRTALWVVGIFTLLSGIVGVSNIMLITVKERTREFGIRKAIGATPWDILKLIIAESVIITSVFGYIGMFCGILANEYMDATIGHTVIDSGLFKATMFVNPTVGLDVCFQATLTIIIAGTIAGLIPAIKATRIRPIEALRAE